jgi:hypothetical protein
MFEDAEHDRGILTGPPIEIFVLLAPINKVSLTCTSYVNMRRPLPRLIDAFPVVEPRCSRSGEDSRCRRRWN